MIRRSAHLSWFEHRGAVFVYHDLTGYIVEMSPDLKVVVDAFDRPRDLEPVRDNLGASLGRHTAGEAIDVFLDRGILVEDGCDELQALHNHVPVKARWIVVHDTGETVAAWLGRNPATPPRSLEFTSAEICLWRAIDGQLSMQGLAELLELPLEQVCDTICGWAHSDVQLLRVSPVALSFYKHREPPGWLSSTMPWARLGEGTHGPGEHTHALIDLEAYHQQDIVDAEAQFEEVETTLSHLFREPHPALQGRTYAQATVAALAARKCLPHDGRELQFAEVGGGLGFFAKGVLDALREDYPPIHSRLRYTVYDLSPALQDAQRQRLAAHGEHVRLVLTDGQRLADVPDESIDLLLSNEVIADFQTAVLHRTAESHSSTEWEDPDAMLEALEDAEDEDAATAGPGFEGPAQALEALLTYDLQVHDAPDTLLFNLGAVRFLETAWRVMKPGAWGWITEFGDRWRYPLESTHLDHAEVSIHFGQMQSVARKLGFEAEVLDVFDMLEFEPDVETLASTRTWFRNLGALARAHGGQLRKVAYTPEQLQADLGSAQLTDIENLTWHRVEDRVMGLVPRDFLGLLIRKPESQR